MSDSARWLEALSAPAGAKSARILFRRLGAVALCTPLTSSEIAECVEMGGEKGARYALYLSCAELREAGALLAQSKSAPSPLDITGRIPYADVMAAARIVLSLSGADRADIRILEEQEDEQEAINAPQAYDSAPVPSFSGGGSLQDASAGSPSPVGGENGLYFPFSPSSGLSPLSPLSVGGAGDGSFEGENPQGLSAALVRARRESESTFDFARELAEGLRDAAGNM